MEDHKHVTCLPVEVQPFHGGLLKQTITATSSNHAELLELHEASRECVWLRSLI